MKKMIVFDMDGTLANLYNEPNWLEDLQNGNARPYENAQPLVDMEDLAIILNLLKEQGWKIAVTSWLSKNSTKGYDNKVRRAKREWLERYGFPFDEIHLVKYGTKKDNCTKNKADFQILVDDNQDILNKWQLGGVINATQNILLELVKLLED